MITISEAHANARLEGSRTHMVLGTSRPKLRLYGGTRPANGVEPGTPLLAEIELLASSAVIAGGVLTIQQFEPGLILSSGDPTWGRIVNGNGAHNLDCDVGASGEVVLSASTLYEGGRVVLTSAVFA
jgi:hypothetical protein